MRNELLSSYKLNEGSGNIVYDYSITRYGLFGTGNINNCWINKDLYLDGQIIQVPNRLGLKNLTTFTLLSDVDFKQKKVNGRVWGDLGFENGYLKYGPISSNSEFQSGYIAASVSGDLVNLYINGQNVGSGTYQSKPWDYQIGGALSAKIKDFRIYGRNLDQKEVSILNNENSHLLQKVSLFGTVPINNTLNLFIGAGAGFINSGINLSSYGQDVYLVDEQGSTLYDELGNPLLPEATIPLITFRGFDCFMSGTQDVSLSLNLFLQQSGLTNLTNNSLPLSLLSSGFVAQKSVNLYLSNLSSGAQSGVNLSIEGDGGIGFNDGYTPITNAMNLFINRNENGYVQLFISGATNPIATGMNLFLNSNWTSQSGSINLITSGKDITQASPIYLYSHGF